MGTIENVPEKPREERKAILKPLLLLFKEHTQKVKKTDPYCQLWKKLSKERNY